MRKYDSLLAALRDDILIKYALCQALCQGGTHLFFQEKENVVTRVETRIYNSHTSRLRQGITVSWRQP